MDTGMTGTWFDQLIKEPVQSLLTQLLTFIPRLAGAIFILIVGWWIAKAVEVVVVRVLHTIPVDKIADQIQLSSALAKGGIKRKISELLGAIIYWFVILAVVVIAFTVLQLPQAAMLFQEVVDFLPRVVASVFLLIVGVFAAAFLATTVRTAASNSGILQAHLLGQAVQTIVVVLSVVTALKQLQIEVVDKVLFIILGGISLGCALAFGLGCKDLAGRWVSSFVDQVQARKR